MFQNQSDNSQAESIKSLKKLVAIREGLSAPEAMIIRSTLMSEGVEAHIRSLGMTSIHPVVQADVLVRGRDKRAAEDILNALEDSAPHIQPMDKAEIGDDIILCPYCGAEDVEPLKGRVRSIIPGVSYTARAYDRWHQCNICNGQFQNKITPMGGLGFAIMWAAIIGFVMLFLLDGMRSF